MLPAASATTALPWSPAWPGPSYRATQRSETGPVARAPAVGRRTRTTSKARTSRERTAIPGQQPAQSLEHALYQQANGRGRDRCYSSKTGRAPCRYGLVAPGAVLVVAPGAGDGRAGERAYLPGNRHGARRRSWPGRPVAGRRRKEQGHGRNQRRDADQRGGRPLLRDLERDRPRPAA